MTFAISTQSLDRVNADALVILHTPEDGLLAKPENASLARHAEAFVHTVADKSTRAEWFCTLEQSANVKTRHLLLDSAVFVPAMPPTERLKTAAAHAAEVCRRYSLTKLAFACDGDDAPALAAAIAEGISLGDFVDTRFKSAPEKRPPLRVQLVVDPSQATAVKRAVQRVETIAAGVNLARELVNAPNNVLFPRALASEAQRVAKSARLECRVLDAKRLKREGYNLITAVGVGSEHPPCMIVLRYKPKKAARRAPHIVLAGKGICFDTGGLCIKTRDAMHTMNGDMGGGAAVIGAIQTIAALGLPARVTALIPAAFNAVDGAAYHPGSIHQSKNGKTVYIENTDAEGRLVLADAFALAAKEKPDVLIDFATLTGAAAVSLGPQIGALFTNDAELRDVFESAGRATGDAVWPLPLWQEYEPSLGHPLADLNNISSLGQYGGAIHAANFLKAFVPTGVRWAHLDMSAPARAKTKTRYFNVGATGYGVRLVVDAMEQLAGGRARS